MRVSLARSVDAISRVATSNGLNQVRDSLRAARSTMDRLLARSREMATGISRAEGTIGRATADPALPLAVERTRASLDSLAAHLGANPLAWLRVRLF